MQLQSFSFPASAARRACSDRNCQSLWQFGRSTVADTRRADSMAAIARQILETAPPRFALAGLSMGGYISFEIMRQAPERVLRLALLDTAPRADRPDQTERRNTQIAMVREGRFSEVPALLFPLMVHPEHQQDEELHRTFDEMFLENGADAFIRQQEAIKSRPNSAPLWRPSAARPWCWSATAIR